MIATVPGGSSGAAVSIAPFPGLRPFEPHEAKLFFGREEQGDELLARLARRRMVAVVGASGSGKSSLVRAGLIPALERGYLPSAGTSWQIAVCRPGADPIGNLARSVYGRRTSGAAPQPLAIDRLRELLDANSLGLAAVGRALLTGTGDSLLVIIDQFEELFRFRRVGGPAADEQAAEFVKLLLGAAEARDVSTYVVITMRSDYLGDCAHFSGLPEALNDSQFLVPQMTRDQLKEAIEGPISVCEARITPRLVQRLLHDVEQLSRVGRRDHLESREPDPLPLLQHALMRVWAVSHDARAKGDAIDLAHYAEPPVSTIWNALDLHAEEAYGELPDEESRLIAARVFQRLTERDPDNRDVRRPTAIDELTAVALGLERPPTDADRARVRRVIERFALPGRSFVIVDAQGTVDISHESLIRQWKRLRGWVEREAAAKRVYTALADSAGAWKERRRSLYRGPELTEALRWWRAQRPSAAWAERYGGGLETVSRFVQRSQRARLLGRLTLAAVAAVFLVLTAALVIVTRRQAAIDAQLARERQQYAEEIKRSNDLYKAAIEAAKQGQSDVAARLTQQANQVEQQANTRAPLSPAEATELEQLRKQSSQWKDDRAQLQKQIDDLRRQAAADARNREQAQTPVPTSAPVSPTPAPTAPPTQPPPPVASASPTPAPTRPPATPPPSSKPGGNPVAAFRDGVRLADLNKWDEAARAMRGALQQQGSGPAPPGRVLIYGMRYEFYAPHAYLALALMQLGRCDEARAEIALTAGENKSNELENRLRISRGKCP